MLAWSQAQAPVQAQAPIPGASTLPGASKESPQPGKDKPAELSAPPGAILILCEKAADTLRLLPKMVLLPPEKYQELLDELARLRESKAAKPLPPSFLRLDGRVESGQVKWKAQISFVTEKPGQQVALGFASSPALSALLHGEIPLMKKTAEGFFLQVENPGRHELVMELASGITRNGERQVVELDLPGAAITQFTLALPKDSIDPQVMGKPGPDPLVSFREGVLTAGAGATTKVEIQWRSGLKESQPRALASESAVLARVSGKELQIRAEVRVIPLGGPMSSAELKVPLGATVRGATPADEAKIKAIENAESPFFSTRKILLKEPLTAPLRLLVEKQHPLGSGGTFPIGPLNLSGAIRQTGTILLANSGETVRLLPQLRNEALQQEITPADRALSPEAVASFRYWNPPQVEKPTGLTGAGSLAIFDLQVSLVSGLLEVRVDHLGKIVREESGIPQWRITATFDCNPVRTGASQIEIQVPAGLRFDASRGPIPAALIRDIQETANGKMTLFFAQDLLRPFQFSLEFTADVALDHLSSIPLPVPVNVRERGGQVTLTTPADFELFASEKANPALETISLEPHKQAWSWDKFPLRVEAQLRQIQKQPDLVQTVDFFLEGQEFLVKQRIRFLFPGKVIPAATLTIPPSLNGLVKVTKGGRGLPVAGMEGVLEVSFINPGQREHEIELEYSLAVGLDMAADLALVQPAVGAGEITARVWAEPGMEFTSRTSPWRLATLDDLAGFDRFPNAVFKAKVPGALALHWERKSAPLEKVARALARVWISPTSVQYRVGFSFNSLSSGFVDLQLPKEARGFRAFHDNREVNWRQLEGERLVRVTLPRGSSPGKPLEVEYSRPAGTAFSFSGQTLAIPVMDGESFPVKWWVRYSPKEIPLSPEPAPGQDFSWVRSGVFFTRLARVQENQVEQWLAQGSEDPSAASARLAGLGPLGAAGETLIFRDTPEPLALHLVSRGLLQVALSGLLLVGGFWLKSRPGLWQLASGQTAWLALGMLFGWGVLATLRPSLTATLLMGLQPALAIFLVFLMAAGLQRALAWNQSRRYSTFSSSVAAADSVSISRVGRKEGSKVSQAPAQASTGYWTQQDGSTPPKPVIVGRSTSTHPPDNLPD